MTASLGLLAAFALGLSSAPPAAGEPYLALRTGLKCAACHVNRSGGGGRNDFGSSYGQTALPWRTDEFRSRSLNDWLAVGFDLRAVATGTFRSSEPRTSIDIDEAQAYIEARFLRDRVALYIDQTVGPNRAVTREIVALVERLPLNGYAKAGKLLLPYGLRLKDDDEFIRGVTGFNYDTPDQGVEVGVEPGPLSVAVALTNGTQGSAETNTGKQVTSTVAFVRPRYRIGASASRNSGGGARRDVIGGFGGLQVGRVVLLGELDFIAERSDIGSDRDQLVAFAEADVLLRRGLNAKVTYGIFDRNRDVAEDERIRMRFGLEAFPVPFVQASAFYILDENIPQATDDLDRAQLELRLFF